MSVQFSCSVMSNSLRPNGLQHTRPPCPSPTPAVYSDSRPLSRWCHPIISSSAVPFFSHLQSFPSIRIFSNESALRIRWPKYWSFSFNISPFNEHPGMISFRMDSLDLLAVQVTLHDWATSVYVFTNVTQNIKSTLLVWWHSNNLWYSLLCKRRGFKVSDPQA